MSFSATPAAIRVFYSYEPTALRDKNLLRKIRDQLGVSRRARLIDDAYDSGCVARGIVEKSIEHFMKEAKIIVLLVSPNYFSSTRCFEVEMKLAIERQREENVRLIPVQLHATELETSPLGGHLFFPRDGKPVKRPSSVEMDNVLVELGNEIRKAAEEIAGLTDNSSCAESQLPLNTIPYEHSRFFTDRLDIFTKLHDYFTSVQEFRQTRILALSGMPGCGKSQIATEYALTYKGEYKTVLWLEATSRHALYKAIVSSANALSFSAQDREDEEHLFGALKRWLQQYDDWLLILDNIKDLRLMDLFLTPLMHGHILLTTYSQATGERAYPIPVEQMATKDSALFLLRRAGIIKDQALLNEASESERLQALNVVDAVDGLPLALDQAGAYIEEKSCTLSGYLERYRDCRSRIKLLEKRGRNARIHPDSVKATLSLAFQEVAQEHPAALSLLRLFAFLHSSTIHDEMIEQGAFALDKSLRTLATEALALDEAIDILLKFSLIQRRTDTAVSSIHHIVQDILIEDLMPNQQRQWAKRIVRMMNRVFPDAEFSNWPTCAKYFSQACHCAELIATFQLTQKEAARLLQRLGTYCYHLGSYWDAERYLAAALELYEQKIGTDQPATAQTLNNLALLYHKQGKYRKAEELYQRALRIREQIYGEYHSFISQTLNNLALVYQDEGRYSEAEELYQRVLLIDERTVGLDHPDMAVSLSNLAAVYDDQGKYSQAEELYQQAFSIEERTLPPDHPDRALSLNKQAEQQREQGHYLQAEKLYQHALALQQRSIGPKHADVALTLSDLAGLYTRMGRYPEAEALYQQALTISKQALGPEHPDIASILNNLGYLFRQQERYQEAEAWYKQALTLYQQTQGPEHADTANVLNSLGRLYHLMEKDELAEPFLRRGLDIRERVLGLEHPETCQSLSALVELLIHQSLYEQAEPLYRRILQISRQISGPRAPDIVLMQEQYLLLLEHIKPYQKP